MDLSLGRAPRYLGALPDASDYAPEDCEVNGIERIPVYFSSQPSRLKPCAAAEKSAAVLLLREVELQPGGAGEFHLGS